MALPFATASCATIGLADPVHDDTPLAKKRSLVPRNTGAAGAVLQDGATVDISAGAVCDEQERAIVHRKSRYDRVNETAWRDWFWGIGGAAVAVVGGVVIVDAQNVNATDRDGRDYNPLGSDASRGIGVGMVAVGAGMMLVPVVDAFRAAGQERTEGQATLEPKTVRSGIPCEDSPLVGAAVKGVADGFEVELGPTDADGRLALRLEELVEREPRLFQYEGPFRVTVRGAVIGRIDLGPAYDAVAQAYWEQAEPDRCLRAETSDACEAVRRFVKAFPESERAPDAAQVLLDAQPGLAVARDHEAWAASGADACRDPKTPEACDGVQGYIEERPDGEHAAEAAELMRAGAPKVAAAERRRKAEEQKRAAAERAAEQRFRSCVQRKCAAICKMRHRRQSAREGCMELCNAEQVGHMCEGAQ